MGMRNDEIWDLPVGWNAAPLGRLVDIQSGFGCSRKNLVPASIGVAHLRPFNVGTDGRVDLSQIYYIPPGFKDNVEDYALEPGNVLFNNTNSVELVGKTALVTEPMPCAFSNHIYRLTVKERARGQLEPAWLALALRQLWATGYFAEQCNRWIGQAGFNAAKLKEVAIPIPPLDEQRRIVARIEELSERMEEARRLRVAAEEDAERLMPAALAEILDVAKSQHMCQTIGDLLEAGLLQIIGGGTPSKKHQAFWSGTIPWVSPKDMKRWNIDDTEDHITSEAVDRSSAKLIPEGAVLVVVRGMILARTWPVAIAGAELTINQDMKALCPSNGLIPEYLGYTLRGSEPDVLNRVETAAHGTKRLKTKTLEAVEIPIPPVSEQLRIVDHLDRVQTQVVELERLQAASLAELERLTGAVLARAFRGEL
jgi:type I restriction enzyme S subunit